MVWKERAGWGKVGGGRGGGVGELKFATVVYDDFGEKCILL